MVQKSPRRQVVGYITRELEGEDGADGYIIIIELCIMVRSTIHPIEVISERSRRRTRPVCTQSKSSATSCSNLRIQFFIIVSCVFCVPIRDICIYACHSPHNLVPLVEFLVLVQVSVWVLLRFKNGAIGYGKWMMDDIRARVYI